jgi:hypothetical protein
VRLEIRLGNQRLRVDNLPVGIKERNSMRSKKAKRLQAEIEALHSRLVEKEEALAKLGNNYVPQIASICSCLMVRQAQLTELSTRRLIQLTWGLVALTAALLLFTIALYKEAHALTQLDQTSQRHSPSASVSAPNSATSVSSPGSNLVPTNLPAPPAKP